MNDIELKSIAPSIAVLQSMSSEDFYRARVRPEPTSKVIHGETVELRDVIDEPHDAKCICDDCTKAIADEIGKDFIFNVHSGGKFTFYHHIDPLVDSLRARGFREANAYADNMVQYINHKTFESYTIARFECADTYED
jgi:hypothetical protein